MWLLYSNPQLLSDMVIQCFWAAEVEGNLRRKVELGSAPAVSMYLLAIPTTDETWRSILRQRHQANASRNLGYHSSPRALSISYIRSGEDIGPTSWSLTFMSKTNCYTIRRTTGNMGGKTNLSQNGPCYFCVKTDDSHRCHSVSGKTAHV
ncbi:predicted protein [Histoplasma capsulatum G186AR]|uniref:Uncharacterized protein n=1 Tax=Ajellomyces capsulatus (strain G186AR / H82 / ATCC MYA-2454 / RMSCC 2432) TaxID=447093 RepID=C0NW90_AJECG|nr:uncharacterized protein HCBG_07420 [Histoplasma capsulatum G186AR]EEH04195.1 predicted protein [Histoplasma capsulatum G186AR]